MEFIGRNVGPDHMVHDLVEGEIRHGLSDGSWSLIDLLERATERVGPEATLYLSVWTASGDHAKRFLQLLMSGKLAAVSMVVDRSFPTRHPAACEAIREAFGDSALRMWSSHAKFALFRGGRIPLLMQFSANLNRNRRIENYTAFADAAMCDAYFDLLSDLWQRQGDGTAFDDPPRARRDTAAVLGERLNRVDDFGIPDFDLPDLDFDIDMEL